MLAKYEEIEFANLLSLTRAKKVPVGYNFECPICMEGKSRGRKRRAYLLINSPQHNTIHFFCQNCGGSMSFKSFLKDFHTHLFEDYVAREKENWIRDLKHGRKKQKGGSIEQDETETKYIQLETQYFRPVAEHMEALKYCQGRKIPGRVIKGLFYVPRTISISEQDEERIEPLVGMVVFPLSDDRGIYGYQGRSVEGKRFHTFTGELGENQGRKFFMDKVVKINQRVYILESIIDSLFIDNSVAMLGSSLSPSFLSTLGDRVYCLDNDVSSENVKKMDKIIMAGEKIVIWPSDVEEKDINEMILAGKTRRDIINTINENTYYGFEAKTKFGFLKMRKKRT